MNKHNYNGKELFEEVELESKELNEKDLKSIIDDEKDISKKASKVDLNRFQKFINQIRLAMSLIKDFKAKRYTDIPWKSIALLATAILYFVNPFDVVPDMLPFFGITDDAFLFATVFKSIQDDLEKYAIWKGVDLKEYF